MITGAASADAAVLVIAANEGVREQSRRHAYLLSLLGIQQIVVVVNKMDSVGYSAEAFGEIEREYRAVSRLVRPAARGASFRRRRAMARTSRGARRRARAGMPDRRCSRRWMSLRSDHAPIGQPLRFCVQDVYRFDERRIIAGRDRKRGVAGRRRAGVFAGEQDCGRCDDRSLECARRATRRSQAIRSASRCASRFSSSAATSPRIRKRRPIQANRFRADIFWLAEAPLRKEAQYSLRLATQEVKCQVVAIEQVMDSVDARDHSARSGARSRAMKSAASRCKRARRSSWTITIACRASAGSSSSTTAESAAAASSSAAFTPAARR